MKERTLFSVDKYEVEANTFAVELLLPDWVVSQYKNTEFTLDDIGSMCLSISSNDGLCMSFADLPSSI